METKFTIRDFFVYFLTGLALIIFLFPLKETAPLKSIGQNISQVMGKNIDMWKSLALIPVIYLLGHIVDCLDIMRLEFARLIKPERTGKWRDNIKKKIYYILIGDRVSGLLYFGEYPLDKTSTDQLETFETIWEKANFIQIKERYNSSEYWYVMKDLFNSLQCVVVLCIFLLVFISMSTSVEGFYTILIVYMSLLVLFWFKAKYYAGNYIKSTRNTYDCLKKASIDSLEKAPISQ